MDRMCGASVARDVLSAARCWCGGLFCGKGGAKRTSEVRRELHITGHARDRADFFSLLQQADLFDGDALRLKWMARLDTHTTPTSRRARGACSYCGSREHARKACPHRSP